MACYSASSNEEGGRNLTVARVLSGTIRTDQKVSILGPAYEVGKKNDLYDDKAVSQVYSLKGNTLEPVDSSSAGHLVVLKGTDPYLLRHGTVASSSLCHSLNIFGTLPVTTTVRVAVEPKDAADLPKMVEALRRLARLDYICDVLIEETGEHTIHAQSEVHLKHALRELAELAPGLQFNVSAQTTSMRETVSGLSSKIVMAKSPNKHSRIWMTAQPMDTSLLDALDQGRVQMQYMPSLLTKAEMQETYLVKGLGWDVQEARKLWMFGPGDMNLSNVLVNKTRGVEFLSEQKPFVWYDLFHVVLFCEFKIHDLMLTHKLVLMSQHGIRVVHKAGSVM
jgi:elongation factor 2